MPSLVILILHDTSRFEELLAAWHDAGASAVTIFDGAGTRDVRERLQREELPLLPSIRDLLSGDDAPRKMVLSIVPDEAVDPLIKTTEDTVGDLMRPGNGILFALPVARVVGLREADT